MDYPKKWKVYVKANLNKIFLTLTSIDVIKAGIGGGDVGNVARRDAAELYHLKVMVVKAY